MADTLFPVFLKLTGRTVVVVGGGRVAAAKVPALVSAGADVVVIAPSVCDAIVDAGVHVLAREFRASDLDGAWYVVAAATPLVNRAVAAAAAERRVFVNAVDDKENASAYLGGVLARVGVTVAISTGGEAPAVAGLLREAIDAVLPEDLERWLDAAERLRADWKRTGVPMEQRRPLLLDALNRIYDMPSSRMQNNEQAENARTGGAGVRGAREREPVARDSEEGLGPDEREEDAAEGGPTGPPAILGAAQRRPRSN